MCVLGIPLCIKEPELQQAGIPTTETSGLKKSYTLKGPDGASSLGILLGVLARWNKSAWLIPYAVL